MSYVVELTNIRPTWFVNAWNDAYDKERERRAALGIEGRTTLSYYWDHAYPDYVYYDGSFGETETVTFPDEQSYVWFRLRWS